MGNPSDGFHGKTIALSISNFWADVTIHESVKLVIAFLILNCMESIIYSGTSLLRTPLGPHEAS